MSSNNQTAAKSAVEILSRDDYNRVSPLEQHLRKFKDQSDPRFGEIEIYQHVRSKHYIAVKVIKVSTQAAAADLIINARKKILRSHPHLLSVIDYSVSVTSELCSSYYLVKYFLEYPHTDLNREISFRLKNKTQFSHFELIHYLYQQLLALQSLELQSRFHGDVRPLNIAVSKLEVLSKLIDQSDQITTPERSKQIQFQYILRKSPVYMSPVLYENLKKGNSKIQIDHNREDIFALGLSLIEIGNQIPIQNVYAENGNFDEEALDEHFYLFRQNFLKDNVLLTSTVHELINPNEKARLNATELLAKMPKYESIIDYLQQQQLNGQQINYPQPIQVHNQPRDHQMRKVNSSISMQSHSNHTLANPLGHRVDKSAEKPLVIPQRSDSIPLSRTQSTQSFSGPVHGNGSVYTRSPGHSIENPSRVLYLAANADVKQIESSLNEEYKMYLQHQNEIIVKRIYHRYVSPDDERQKSPSATQQKNRSVSKGAPVDDYHNDKSHGKPLKDKAKGKKAIDPHDRDDDDDDLKRAKLAKNKTKAVNRDLHHNKYEDSDDDDNNPGKRLSNNKPQNNNRESRSISKGDPRNQLDDSHQEETYFRGSTSKQRGVHAEPEMFHKNSLNPKDDLHNNRLNHDSNRGSQKNLYHNDDKYLQKNQPNHQDSLRGSKVLHPEQKISKKNIPGNDDHHLDKKPLHPNDHLRDSKLGHPGDKSSKKSIPGPEDYYQKNSLQHSDHLRGSHPQYPNDKESKKNFPHSDKLADSKLRSSQDKSARKGLSHHDDDYDFRGHKNYHDDRIRSKDVKQPVTGKQSIGDYHKKDSAYRNDHLEDPRYHHPEDRNSKKSIPNINDSSLNKNIRANDHLKDNHLGFDNNKGSHLGKQDNQSSNKRISHPNDPFANKRHEDDHHDNRQSKPSLQNPYQDSQIRNSQLNAPNWNAQKNSSHNDFDPLRRSLDHPDNYSYGNQHSGHQGSLLHQPANYYQNPSPHGNQGKSNDIIQGNDFYRNSEIRQSDPQYPNQKNIKESQGHPMNPNLKNSITHNDNRSPSPSLIQNNDHRKESQAQNDQWHRQSDPYVNAPQTRQSNPYNDQYSPNNGSSKQLSHNNGYPNDNHPMRTSNPLQDQFRSDHLQSDSQLQRSNPNIQNSQGNPGNNPKRESQIPHSQLVHQDQHKQDHRLSDVNNPQRVDHPNNSQYNKANQRPNDIYHNDNQHKNSDVQHKNSDVQHKNSDVHHNPSHPDQFRQFNNQIDPRAKDNIIRSNLSDSHKNDPRQNDWHRESQTNTDLRRNTNANDYHKKDSAQPIDPKRQSNLQDHSSKKSIGPNISQQDSGIPHPTKAESQIYDQHKNSNPPNIRDSKPSYPFDHQMNNAPGIPVDQKKSSVIHSNDFMSPPIQKVSPNQQSPYQNQPPNYHQGGINQGNHLPQNNYYPNQSFNQSGLHQNVPQNQSGLHQNAPYNQSGLHQNAPHNQSGIHQNAPYNQSGLHQNVPHNQSGTPYNHPVNQNDMNQNHPDQYGYPNQTPQKQQSGFFQNLPNQPLSPHYNEQPQLQQQSNQNYSPNNTQTNFYPNPNHHNQPINLPTPNIKPQPFNNSPSIPTLGKSINDLNAQVYANRPGVFNQKQDGLLGSKLLPHDDKFDSNFSGKNQNQTPKKLPDKKPSPQLLGRDAKNTSPSPNVPSSKRNNLPSPKESSRNFSKLDSQRVGNSSSRSPLPVQKPGSKSPETKLSKPSLSPKDPKKDLNSKQSIADPRKNTSPGSRQKVETTNNLAKKPTTTGVTKPTNSLTSNMRRF